MDTADPEALASMRIVVGYLGERENHGWWPSSFFSPSSRAFLEPVFPRTMLLAQSAGISAAAAITHDDRIGIGDVFHLFRLPEDVEQRIHALLHAPEVVARMGPLTASLEAAKRYLRTHASESVEYRDGPVRVGGIADIRGPAAWGQAIALYLGAFETGSQAFPFFADRS